MPEPRTYTFTAAQARLLHQQVDNHCKALKNWMANAVEHKEWNRAADLVEELRQYETLFSMTNVDAHEIIDASVKKGG